MNSLCIHCEKVEPVYLEAFCSRECMEGGRDHLADVLRRLLARSDELNTEIKHIGGCFDAISAEIHSLGNADHRNFYRSKEWRELRYAAIEMHGRKCVACGRTPDDQIKIHVDHIKPRSKYPQLALEISNLQILCEECNMGKGNKYKTDWRPKQNEKKFASLELPDF